MSNLHWLTDGRMELLKPFFPQSYGKPRVGDRRDLSGIIFINRNGLRWCDAPKEYGPAKTLHNRWTRWSDNGVFARIIVGLAARSAGHETIMIDATCLKARRTASSLWLKKGGTGVGSGEPQVAWTPGRTQLPRPRGGQSGSTCLPVRWVIAPAQRRFWAACRRRVGFWPTEAMTPIGSEKRWKTRG